MGTLEDRNGEELLEKEKDDDGLDHEVKVVDEIFEVDDK